MIEIHMHFFCDVYTKQNFWCSIRDAKDTLLTL